MAEVRILTLKDKQVLEEELAQLEIKMKQVAEDIKEARSHGDLSENAEYDAAKDEESHVNLRMKEIQELLRSAEFVDDTKVSTDAVALGTVVRVRDLDDMILDDEEGYLTIVGFTEADPFANMISQESEIGKGLMGHHKGDVVAIVLPNHMTAHLEILNISARS